MEQLPPGHVIVALGANLEDPAEQLRRAFDALDALPQARLQACSSLYGSTPVGPVQPDYVNAVAHLQTAASPLQLLDQLQAIEQDHRRVREQRWGPRTLDLDIALFGRRRLDGERLCVPHPRLHERVFVLQPLAELYPNLHLHHLGVSVAEQLARLPGGGIWPLDEARP